MTYDVGSPQNDPNCMELNMENREDVASDGPVLTHGTTNYLTADILS
jgi:hypothetical protein